MSGGRVGGDTKTYELYVCWAYLVINRGLGRIAGNNQLPVLKYLTKT